MTSGYITQQTDVSLFNVLLNLPKTLLKPGTMDVHVYQVQVCRAEGSFSCVQKRHTHKGIQGGKDKSMATWKPNHLSQVFMGSAEFDLSALAIG